MKCDEVRNQLSLYIDGEIEEEEKELIEEHLENCPECKKELEEYKKLIQMLNELPNEEPPEGYCKRLHKKLKEEAESNITNITEMPIQTTKRKFGWKKYSSIAAALVLVMLVYGINNRGMYKSTNDMSYSTTESAPAEISEAPMISPSTEENFDNLSIADKDKGNEKSIRGDSSSPMNIMTVEDREMKIIKSGSLYVQTSDYNKFMDDLSIKINELGGFIENNNTEVYQVYENEKLMHGSLKIRVPQDKFYDVVSYFEETSEIKRKSINENDVTKEYYEKDNQVKNLEIQEQHLRELFDKATTVTDMLQIENELRRIRTEIDSLNISLNDINDRVYMSSIDLEVEEIKEPNIVRSEESVWDRAKRGFIITVNSIIRGIENLIVNVFSSLPILIPILIIFILLLSKIRKYWKKKL